MYQTVFNLNYRRFIYFNFVLKKKSTILFYKYIHFSVNLTSRASFNRTSSTIRENVISLTVLSSPLRESFSVRVSPAQQYKPVIIITNLDHVVAACTFSRRIVESQHAHARAYKSGGLETEKKRFPISVAGF